MQKKEENERENLFQCTAAVLPYVSCLTSQQLYICGIIEHVIIAELDPVRNTKYYLVFFPGCAKSIPLTSNLNKTERILPVSRNEARFRETNVSCWRSFSPQRHVPSESVISKTQNTKINTTLKKTEFLLRFTLSFHYLMLVAWEPYGSRLRGGSHF